MKKKGFIFVVMLGMALALGLIFVGCNLDKCHVECYFSGVPGASSSSKSCSKSGCAVEKAKSSGGSSYINVSCDC